MEPVDLYAERIAPGLWGEPVNTISNIAFLVAAFAVFRLLRKSGIRSKSIATLAGLAFAVGVGSATFHSFATQWSWFLDIVPILAYELVFLGVYLRRVVSWNVRRVALALVALAAATFGFWLLPILQRSLLYLPAMAISFALAAYHARNVHTERSSMLLAAILFVVAYVFRTLDASSEAFWPWGTHFLWHLGNAGVMYLGLRSLVNVELERLERPGR